MSTTAQQDRDFRDHLINTAILEEAIEWIRKNLNPGEVFDEKDLKTWAEENGYMEEA